MSQYVQRVGITAGIAVFIGVLFAATADAHHSFAAEFDINKPIKMSGKLTEMRWSNPHAWLYVDIAEAGGKVTRWSFEMPAANGLVRRGWRKEDLPVGAVLVIEGFQARNGQPVASATTITFTDGRRLFAGSPNDAAK
jgi:hypothetical protein